MQKYTRKQEEVLKKYFLAISIFFIFLLVLLQFNYEILHKDFSGFMYFMTTLMLALYLSFGLMYWQMNKHHNFEFKRTRKSMIIFISSFTFTAIVQFQLVLIGSVVKDPNSL